VIWWLVLGIVVLALLVLAAAGAALLGRLRELGHVGRALQRRAVEAQGLLPAAEALQERVLALQERAELAGDRAALLQARRGTSDDRG
jgi:hypothetical protein